MRKYLLGPVYRNTDTFPFVVFQNGLCVNILSLFKLNLSCRSNGISFTIYDKSRAVSHTTLKLLNKIHFFSLFLSLSFSAGFDTPETLSRLRLYLTVQKNFINHTHRWRLREREREREREKEKV